MLFCFNTSTMLALSKILDFLIPRSCAGCGEAHEAFCRVCRENSMQKSAGCLLCGFRNNIGKFCIECKRKFKPPLESVLWAGRYDGQLKRAVWELKYGKRRELARPLAEMLAEKFCAVYKGSLPAQQFARHEYFSTEKFLCSDRRPAQGLANYLPEDSPNEQKEFALQDIAQRGGASIAIRQQANMRVLKGEAPFVVVPIPLHFKRQHERGFNQAELLAKEFSKITGIEMRDDVLEKTKETPAQVEVQDKELRLKNLEGAFKLNLPPLNPLLSKEGRGVVEIILIDDVATSGATLMHAARALKNAGAGEITGLVVAHGG